MRRYELKRNILSNGTGCENHSRFFSMRWFFLKADCSSQPYSVPQITSSCRYWFLSRAAAYCFFRLCHNITVSYVRSEIRILIIESYASWGRCKHLNGGQPQHWQLRQLPNAVRTLSLNLRREPPRVTEPPDPCTVLYPVASKAEAKCPIAEVSFIFRATSLTTVLSWLIVGKRTSLGEELNKKVARLPRVYCTDESG